MSNTHRIWLGILIFIVICMFVRNIYEKPKIYGVSLLSDEDLEYIEIIDVMFDEMNCEQLIKYTNMSEHEQNKTDIKYYEKWEENREEKIYEKWVEKKYYRPIAEKLKEKLKEKNVLKLVLKKLDQYEKALLNENME